MSNTKISETYNSEIFREQGHQVVDLLAGYLKQVTAKGISNISTSTQPEVLLSEWTNNFSAKTDFDVINLFKKVISQSRNVHHPGYIGHQVSSPLPFAALCDLVASLLNNATTVFEMGPVTTVIERNLIRWMSDLIGFDKNSDGFFTSGGSLGNLTALLAARQAKAGYDVWQNGLKDSSNLVILVSKQAHYSIKKTSQIMGLGEKSIIPISTDKSFCMDIKDLNQKYKDVISEGKKVIAVVGSACTTATGSYDPIDAIADFCEKHDLWLHVDGAHGASVLLSNKYKDSLKGIERADSVVWDAHKMLLMPSLVTAVIFKNLQHSYEAFSQKASYIFKDEHEGEWYNLGHRTFECTKIMMSLKLYLCLSAYGEAFFADYVTSMYDLTKKFAELIKGESDFELAVEPQSNIICFRYLSKSFNDTNLLQKKIRKGIIENGDFYILQADLNNKTYLRGTIINPLTTEEDLKNLLALIKTLGENISE